MNEVRDILDCSTIQTEYWTHVSPQAELPLADAAWRTRTLSELDDFVSITEHTRVDGSWLAGIETTLYEIPTSLHQFRLVTSISDKRLYLDLSYLFSRVIDPLGKNGTLCGCHPSNLMRHPTSFFERLLSPKTEERRRRLAAATIAGYLDARGLSKILDLYASLTADSRLAVLQHWLMPKETQQNEAKRRGHGAEAAIASTLNQIGCRMIPPDKAANPMGAHDPNVSMKTFTVASRSPGRTFSSDIVLPRSDGSVAVCIMGLVQSSDPGQFGVNKSDEIVTLRRLIDSHNEEKSAPPLELWGLVDGVGYSENKAGTVDKMLASFHYFVQVKSAYKAALRAHELGLAEVQGISFDMNFYNDKTREQMIDRYLPEDVTVFEGATAPANLRPITAGAATVWI